MQRRIETTKTYRIPHEGKTALLRVLKVGESTISVEDLKTGRKFSMKRSAFQRGLDEGTIYVSARVGK